MYSCAINNVTIYCEIDEHQHFNTNGSYKCEEKRMSDLYDETPGKTRTPRPLKVYSQLYNNSHRRIKTKGYVACILHMLLLYKQTYCKRHSQTIDLQKTRFGNITIFVIEIYVVLLVF